MFKWRLLASTFVLFLYLVKQKRVIKKTFWPKWKNYILHIILVTSMQCDSILIRDTMLKVD